MHIVIVYFAGPIKTKAFGPFDTYEDASEWGGNNVPTIANSVNFDIFEVRSPTAIYVSAASHRAREKMRRVLNLDTMQGYYSMQRGSTGGYYKVTEKQYQMVKHITGVTKLRGPYDDIMPCW